MFNLLGPTATLPDHVRIELTLTRLPGNFSAGIYYGDGRPMGGITHYGFETNDLGGQSVKNIDRATESIGGLRVNGMPGNLDRISKLGENHLTLDIHHEGSDLYFLEFVNGMMTDFGHAEPQGLRPSSLRSHDEAGVWLPYSHSSAICKDFRVTVLPD